MKPPVNVTRPMSFIETANRLRYLVGLPPLRASGRETSAPSSVSAHQARVIDLSQARDRLASKHLSNLGDGAE